MYSVCAGSGKSVLATDQCVGSVWTRHPPGGTTLVSLALTLSEAALSPVCGRTLAMPHGREMTDNSDKDEMCM